MAVPIRDNKFHMGDRVYIEGMTAEYIIKEMEYDIRRKAWKYKTNHEAGWLFEHILTKAKEGKMKTTTSPGKYSIGQEVSVRGIRNETFIIKEWQQDAPSPRDPYGKHIKYKLSNNDWYDEEMLYIDEWGVVDDDLPIPNGVTEKIEIDDVVQCTTDKGNGAAYRKDYYYLVSSVLLTQITTYLDSNGDKENGWDRKHFRRIKTGPANKLDNSIYICIENTKDNFTKGKTYQLKEKEGYLINDKGETVSILEDDKKYFKTILDNQDHGWANASNTSTDTATRTPTEEEWAEPTDTEKDTRLPPPELRDVDVKTECKMMKPLPIKLEGPVGTGKTTILMELAEELGMKYYANVLTDQTSASEFKGYKNVMNGEYIRTEFREAAEFGGMYVLEELNAATSNLPIIFNTIENGYFVFADKMIKVHPDFWLCATMNNITNAKDFGGRRVVDKSVEDRFHSILVLGDINSRYKASTVLYTEEVNKLLEANGVTDMVTPRDMRRFEHMLENEAVDKEIAIRKCLIGNRMKVEDEWLRKTIKEKGVWK